ncbi:unnamed protein product [Trichogramma brassicae]|uniref:Inositol-phosphate phosphatase n=1 Tax=Trichogramma brassicae TaxID=86971 RepID=A0A6H5IC73_9HYME|nr:unnamed protein product [Trichogramma brassicae]
MVEKLLMNGISAKFPDHKFIGEENTAESNRRVELTDAPTWIIDPVDGTMNFVHAMPHTCISIALYVNKVAEIGIVYNPVIEQFFTARKGKGAFLNGQRIRVSDEKGGDFDALSRRVLCAASSELAHQATQVLVQYYPDRD